MFGSKHKEFLEMFREFRKHDLKWTQLPQDLQQEMQQPHLTRDDEIEELATAMYKLGGPIVVVDFETTGVPIYGVNSPNGCFAYAEEFINARDKWRASRTEEMSDD